ncbi:hypothetical protein B0H17DRAFT_1105167, partial [Mycena rosella]
MSEKLHGNDDSWMNFSAVCVFPEPPSPYSRKICCFPKSSSKNWCIFSRMICRHERFSK